ncbi:hypothetical protein BSKO_01811 [Bryopsis sp. KO-2023]|nr:hypothetical protein BSKO_01811 [Bryopsis sp. KO-2023]
MAVVVRSNVAKNSNESLFDVEDLNLMAALIQEGQSHLFNGWPDLGTNDEGKKSLLEQLRRLEANVPHGLVEYVKRAKLLLKNSRDGVNPLEGFVPSVPSGIKLDFGSDDYQRYEAKGVSEAFHCAFVLVAGGLGERLGYSGIKVALPTESATGRSYLQLYAESILALQSKARAGGHKDCTLPFILMTSDDTHAKTLAFLDDNKCFGMEPGQIHLIKQEKVPCLADNDAHIALSGQFTIQTKPHGHGDIHSLLHSTGLVKKWKENGIKWVCFFQDTNALVFRGLLPALGVSATEDYDMNSLAVPRKAKEAIGAISRLTRESDGAEMTVNVEYNQLDPLLRSTINPEGDVNDETGFSPFPGNINQLVLKVGPYADQLEKTKGVIGEFVNPKYKDDSRTEFKSSTRLECMMQDYPKSLGSGAKVGFTMINQVWATYSPVKNSIESARAKVASGVPPQSAASGEAHMYECASRTLSQLGADIGEPTMGVYGGLETAMYPRIVWSPSFALTFEDLKARINFSKLKVATGSVLVLGGDVEVVGLTLDGAAEGVAPSGAKISIKDETVSNSGWEWKGLEGKDGVDEEIAIRDFKVVKHATKSFASE